MCMDTLSRQTYCEVILLAMVSLACLSAVLVVRGNARDVIRVTTGYALYAGRAAIRDRSRSSVPKAHPDTVVP
jgi:hypothetical protein